MDESMAVVVRPRHPMQTWMSRHAAEDGRRRRQFTDGSVYLVPTTSSRERARRYVRDQCTHIFERELARRCEDPADWPSSRNWSTFQEWFEIHFFAPVEDLSDNADDSFWRDDVRAADAFKDSSEFEAFREDYPDRGGQLWSELVAEFAQRRWDIVPCEIDVSELEHLTLEVFPETVVDFEPDGLELTAELTHFFRFLERTTDSAGASACRAWLEDSADGLADRFEAKMVDPSNFGPRKSMLWRAQDQEDDDDSLLEFFDDT